VLDGLLKVGDSIRFFQTENHYRVEELGVYKIKKVTRKEMGVGEVGYIIANVKTLSDAKIGDTITTLENPCDNPFPGYKEVKPMVFAGIYPVDSAEYENLQDAIEKLKLNDASLVYEPESSAALGFGYRCGFLGLLHMEIVTERFRREFNLELIVTAPSVEYQIHRTNGEIEIIDNPTNFPERQHLEMTQEPYVLANLISPEKYLGPAIQLCHEKRGIQKDMRYLDNNRVEVDFEIPLAEIVYDFHDKLKSVSRGYASYDYHIIGYRPSDLVRVDILVNAKKVDAFSHIIHKDKALTRGRAIVEKLKDVIPRHMFQVPIQAAIGGTIIARENIRAMRKDVTAKCYGGDISRKRKLLEKQKEGKKRMKQIGSVEIPQEAFLSVLKV
ncbi:MAG: translation elongation factor 4, partial [Spirochaetota bacterium]|nr:translation elongation factor 4 [Spirochaetota bacterium]